MAKGEIESTALTLRFKHGKTTVLLFTEPLAPFSTIKTELLATLEERYPEGLPASSSDPATKIPIPKSVIDVKLGVPVDAFDPSKGWTEIDTRGAAAVRETPKSLGLKDGGMVAVAFTGDEEEEPEFWVEFSNVDELYPDE